MIFTIGHSTRSLEEFVALLKAHGVSRLADIRTLARSRRYPHFAHDALAEALPRHGVAYAHFPGLGGLRRPLRASINTAWRNDSFRGYADYMGTEAFERALIELLAFADGANTAVMCAEAVWWRCHRRLVADALVARDMEVFHIVGRGDAAAHRLSTIARVDRGRVTYPGEGLQPPPGTARLNG
jgi:uncharacterized protein (DUF488 family)